MRSCGLFKADPAFAGDFEFVARIFLPHNGICFIQEPLIRYRQHAANQIDLPRLYWRADSLWRSRRPETERLVALMRSLHYRLSRGGAPQNALKGIQEKSTHLRRRLSLRESRS